VTSEVCQELYQAPEDLLGQFGNLKPHLGFLQINQFVPSLIIWFIDHSNPLCEICDLFSFKICQCISPMWSYLPSSKALLLYPILSETITKSVLTYFKLELILRSCMLDLLAFVTTLLFSKLARTPSNSGMWPKEVNICSGWYSEQSCLVWTLSLNVRKNPMKSALIVLSVERGVGIARWCIANSG